mgnify:FL=1
MKKTIALLLALLCTFSAFALTSCDASAYDLYTKGVKSFTEAKSADVKMTTTAKMNLGGSTSNTTTTVTNIKTNGDNYAMTSDMFNITYVDGILYTSISLGGETSKTKCAVSAEDAMKALSEDGSVAPEDVFPTITEDDLKDVKVEKKDGKKTITTSLSESAIKKLTDGIANSTGDATDADSFSIKDVTMTVSFDKKNQVTDLRLTFKMSISAMGQTMDAEMDILMEINSINQTEAIKAPADADQYEEEENLFS